MDTCYSFEDAPHTGTAVKTYSWDIDSDGSVDSTEATFTHAFPEPGKYRVRLTVTDQEDRTGTDEVLVDAH